MRKSVLIEILGKLTQKEIKEFGEYIASPFFNKNENVVKLFAHIKKYHPEYSSDRLDKEIVFEKIFGRKSYDDGYMRINMFRLQKLAENFLAYKNLTGSGIFNKLCFADELLKRNLNKNLEKELKTLESNLDDVKFKDEKYYENRYKFEYTKFVYHERYAADTFKYRKMYTQSEIFPDHTKPLVIHFLLNMLREYRFILNEQLMFNLKYSFEFLDEMLAYLNKSKLVNEIPLLKIHYLELMLLKDKDDKYYYELKEVLFKEIDNLSWEIKTVSSSVLTSYCSFKILDGFKEFRTEKFELNKLELKYKLYSMTEGGSFDDNTFMDIFHNAIGLRKLDWAENFIKKYHNMLEDEYKNILYYYSYAEIFYNKGEFEKALESLSKISRLPSIDYKLYVRELTIRIYFELNLVNEYFNALDSFRHFLSSNKLISEDRKQRFLNFTKHANTLMRLRVKEDFEGLRHLKREISMEAGFAARRWIIDKIDKITNKK